MLRDHLTNLIKEIQFTGTYSRKKRELWKMIQKGEYKSLSLSEHILQNIKEDLNKTKIPNIIWSKLRLFTGEIIKKPSLFLQGVC